MRNLKYLAVIISIFIFNTAIASDWRVFSESDEKEHSYDLDSIFKAPNGTIQVWNKTNYLTTDQTAGNPPELYFSKLHLYGMDCPNRTMATLQSLTYKGANGYGKLLDSWVNNSPAISYAAPAPDTIGESLWKIVCQGQKKSAPARRKE